MRFLAIALVFMLASSCFATNKRNLAAEMPRNLEEKLSRKVYGKLGTDQFDHVTDDDNDHHYIPRKDYGTHPPGKE